MIGALLKKEWKSNWLLLVIFMGVLSLYSSMILSMFDPKLGESLTMMAESMPDIFAAFGMTDTGSTLGEFLANYLYGFLLIAFPLVYIILLTNRLVTSYVDRGSMACLLSSPHSRREIICTQGGTLLLSVVLLDAFVYALSLLLAQALFPGELPLAEFALVNLGLFFLHVFFAGLNFASACIFSHRKYAMGVGAGASIAFLLAQMISREGDKFQWVQYCTPLSLFDPKALAQGDCNALALTFLLLAAGALLFLAGATVFCKKDLSI